MELFFFCFNPLHCGAVVASNGSPPRCRGIRGFQSPSLRGSGRFGWRLVVVDEGQFVSIPFIAGQWSLQAGYVSGGRTSTRVSIPFIAGQWSLRAARRRARRPRWKFQSPSLRGSGRFAGAPRIEKIRSLVSIPFIAGQWSLRFRRSRRSAGSASFQSPSLRGSGRFKT